MFNQFRQKTQNNQEKQPKQNRNSIFLNSNTENQVIENKPKPGNVKENILPNPQPEIKPAENSNLNNLISGIIEDDTKIEDFRDLASDEELQEIQDIEDLENENFDDPESEDLEDLEEVENEPAFSLPPEESAETAVDIIDVVIPFALRKLSGNPNRKDPHMSIEKRKRLEKSLARWIKTLKIDISPGAAVLTDLANIYLADTVEAGAERFSIIKSGENTHKMKAIKAIRESEKVRDLRKKSQGRDNQPAPDPKQTPQDPPQQKQEPETTQQPPQEPQPPEIVQDQIKDPYRCLYCNEILSEGEKLYFCSKEHSQKYGLRKFGTERKEGVHAERTLKERKKRLMKYKG